MHERMRQAAERRHLSARQIAERMGISRRGGVIYKWWSGKQRPTGPGSDATSAG